MRAVNCLCALRGTPDCRILLCHVLRSHSIFHEGDEATWQKFEAARMEPMINDSMACLMDAGLSSDQVAYEIITDKMSRASGVVERAAGGKFDTIVVGRRGLNVIKEFFLGRVGKKIFQLAGDFTVWVVR
jgi:hypothetical protein